MTRLRRINTMLLRPHKIYYNGFLSKQEFLKLSNEAKGDYLRFLNMLTPGNTQMISLALNVKLDKVYEMMYEFELAPYGDSLEPEDSDMFYYAIRNKEERLLKERHIETKLIISLERIVSRYLVISADTGVLMGAFDTAHDEVVAKEITAIDDLFCDCLSDDDVRKSLEEFKSEQDKRIESEENLSLLPNREIRMMLSEMNLWSDEDEATIAIPEEEELSQMKKRATIKHAGLMPEELKNYVLIENIIRKPAAKMSENDIQTVVDGCPIKPVAEWSKVKNDAEYLRQLRLYFQHVSVIKIAQELFRDTVNNSTLGKKFIALRVKMPTLNRYQAQEYKLENLAFDRWISDGLQDAGNTSLDETTKDTVNHKQALPSKADANPVKIFSKTTVSSAKHPAKPDVDTARADTAATNHYRLVVEITGDDPVQLYSIYVELLELYRGDSRGKILFNPYMDA